mgnify:FL=1
MYFSLVTLYLLMLIGTPKVQTTMCERYGDDQIKILIKIAVLNN